MYEETKKEQKREKSVTPVVFNSDFKFEQDINHLDSLNNK